MRLFLLLALAFGLTSPAFATFKVYMASSGCSGSNSGTNSGSPVCTLQQALNVVQTNAPTQDIEVHIAAGTYTGQTVVWSYVPKSGSTIYKTTFTPLNFGTNRPHFDGQGNKDRFFVGLIGTGERTNFHFRYLKVSRYANGIKMEGNYNDPTKYNSHNTFKNLYFFNMGSIHSTNGVGNYDIQLINSRNNTVEDNRFTYSENSGGDAGKMHGVYLINNSNDNVVRDNEFENISGSGIKIRHQSNDNLIEDNSFNLVGQNDQIADFPCLPAEGDNCTVPAGLTNECPSARNTIRNNAKGADDVTTTTYIDLFKGRKAGQELSLCSGWTGPRATVTGTVHIPIARGETVTMQRQGRLLTNSNVQVLLNDTDGDGDTLTIHAAVTDQGSAQFTISGSSIIVTSASAGAHRIRYEVKDPSGNIDYAYINITVT